MSIGAGIAIVGVAAAVAGTIIGIARQGNKCGMHDMVISDMAGMKDWLIRVEGKIDEVIKRAAK